MFIEIAAPTPREVQDLVGQGGRDLMPGISSVHILFHKKLGHKVMRITSNDGMVRWGFFKWCGEQNV